MRSRRVSWALAAILLLAGGLRLSLAWQNRYAEDDHMGIIERIADTGTIPTRADCRECFQPKLFHVTAAGLIQVFRPEDRILCIQLLNVGVGLLTLLLVLALLGEMALSPSVRWMIFALAALNPQLITINAQVTNDSFAILFGAAGTYFLYLYAKRQQLRALVALCVCTIAGALTKGSGLGFFLVVVFCVFLIGIHRWRLGLQRRRDWAAVGMFLVVFVGVVGLSTPYLDDFHKFGSPLTLNEPLYPAPHLFQKSDMGEGGVVAIAHSFFTFRPLDLILHPLNIRESSHHHDHQESLWSQLYGRMNFSRLEQWPAEWRATSAAAIWVGRASLILALYPLFCFLAGIILTFRTTRLGGLSNTGEWVLLLVSLAYLGMSVVLNYRYRQLMMMQVFYLFPAYLGFFGLTAIGFESVVTRIKRARPLRYASQTLLALLLLSYTLDTSLLVSHLSEYRRNNPRAVRHSD